MLHFEMTPRVYVNLISQVTCVGLCEEEPQTVHPMHVLDMGVSHSRKHTDETINTAQSTIIRYAGGDVIRKNT